MKIENILDSNQNLDDYPLLGVPFTCKELIGVKGKSLRWMKWFFCNLM